MMSKKFEAPVIGISARLAASRLHYAWVILALTFVVIVVTAGVRATSGVLIVPFENEFHWSRATISFAIGINLLVYGLVGPFAAAAMDRFGVRRTMALSLTVAAAGVALSPLMHNPWQLVMLWGLVVGLSTGFVGAYLAAYIAARWFHARQGMVVGLLTAANAAGQLIFLPTNAALIAYAGWRAMVLTLAGIVLLVVLPLLFLMHDHPQDLARRAAGHGRRYARGSPRCRRCCRRPRDWSANRPSCAAETRTVSRPARGSPQPALPPGSPRPRYARSRFRPGGRWTR
jgi:MFS family permease